MSSCLSAASSSGLRRPKIFWTRRICKRPTHRAARIDAPTTSIPPIQPMPLRRMSPRICSSSPKTLPMAFPLFSTLIWGGRLKRQERPLKLQGLTDARHPDFCRMALHRGDKGAGVGSKDIECAIMAGDDSIKVKEAFDRERGRLSAHGEAVADRNDANLRCMNFRDQIHVGKNIRIAHVVDAGCVFRFDDDAVRISKIDHLAIGDCRG